MKGKATIQMVAERAGVSRGTVDRVLNGRPHVNEEARRKVLEAAEALGYVPLSQRRQEEGPAGLTLGIFCGEVSYHGLSPTMALTNLGL